MVLKPILVLMGSEIVVEGKLCLLSPIRTSATREEPIEGPPETTDGVEEECVTPKTEEHMLKPVLVCPPAPKKLRPAKRKLGPPQRAFYVVPPDLTSVFLALASPPKKRIRVD